MSEVLEWFKRRRALAKEAKLKAGMAVLPSQLSEAIERAADSCEDACDQIKIIIGRR